MNQRLLQSMRNRKGRRNNPEPIVSRDKHPDPYMEAGSHPDIVEHVWETLGSSLPVDCRAIVYGTPALVHPDAGVVFALAYGTRYAIRVPDESIHEALEAGCWTEQEWSGGGRTNIEEELGRGWLFGCWAKEETLWLARVYADLGTST